ncbi:MAG: UPF0182 family protein, partial [Spirochaetota bacterium]
MKQNQLILAVVVAVLFVGGIQLANFYVDYAWFDNYGKARTFWTLFLTRYSVHAAFSLGYLLLFGINLLLLRVFVQNGRFFSLTFLRIIPGVDLKKKHVYMILTAALLILSFIMGAGARAFWEEILTFLNQTPFDSFPKDPVFGRDIAFYVFSLPFYNFVYGWVLSTLITIIVFSAFFHVINGGVRFAGSLPELSTAARRHFSVLIAMLFTLFAWGYRLASFHILFSQRGKFFGAGYTAVNAQHLAYKICMVLSVIAALIMLFNLVRKSYTLALVVFGTTIVIYFVLGSLLPSFQQRFIVEPNELAKEKPFIENNIAFTRFAYRLDKIRNEQFKNEDSMNAEAIERNDETIHNIRLWDWKPLKQTYRQLQELKPYYSFLDVDVDRYTFDGSIKAVNISARELLTSKLSENSQTWINTHLVYTHGYGIVMNKVDRITPEGLPEMIVKDIPPQSDVITIDRPEIYYGEHDNDFIITNTQIEPGEFDYPSGEKNKYTVYEEDGGILLDSVWKRAAYAIAFGDINILISSNITDISRIHYRRNIKQITDRIVPYLLTDRDPYVVVSGGRLFYMIDAYTMTNNFPYSTPIFLGRKKINYISNAVKITIDAYTGETHYYIADDTDPLIRTYANIFPNVFEEIEAMPEGLKNHVRYPESLFDVQSHVMLRYHMQDVTVFYNNEDAWEIPHQIYDSTEEQMESYYIVTKLPGETESEFVLMMPFTPAQKDNMLAFLVARCDGEKYGEIILYRLPKERLSYGPMQIEARINQDADISKQLTLWSQKGSRVIRGNMLAIPIEQALLFVEPLYLKAETSEMPELKRVIVAYKDRIVMGENLEQALEQLFGIKRRAKRTEEPEDDSTAFVTETS